MCIRDRFWLYSETVDRMNSAQDIRAVRVSASVLNSDSYKDTMERLKESVGDISIYEGGFMDSKNERDPGATAILKSLM